MYTALVLAAALAAQPDPKQPLGEPKLDPFIVETTKPDDKDTPLRKLQKQRARERALALGMIKQVIKVGNADRSTHAEFARTQATLAENLAELVDKPADKVKCHEMRVAALKELEEMVASLVQVGQVRPQDLNLAKAARIDAEIDLLKLKGPDAKPAAADEAEALLKQSIADINTLADVLEKKDPEAKIKAAGQKLKLTMDQLKDFKVSKAEDERLKKKYEKELMDSLMRMMAAAMKNPEGAKTLEEIMKSLGGKSP